MTGALAASLRVPLAIERLVATPDGGGGLVRGWETLASVWASVEGLSGHETWRGMQNAATATHRIRLRFRDDLDTGMRLVAGARTFQIKSLRDPDGRKELLEILAEEGPFHDA